ncbi:MAG: helix-turn-helix domain-containing protein [Clostridiales bacterium]|nr:helix-turn-helix domain-containing protein [Clostridiales bacterium]
MRNEAFIENLEQRKEEQLPIVFTPAEAMDILGVGRNTIYRLLNSGELHGVRVGHCWRISNAAIDEFLISQIGWQRG